MGAESPGEFVLGQIPTPVILILKFLLQVWKNELDSVRAEWQEDVEDKEKKIKLLQTAMQVGKATFLPEFNGKPTNS